MTRNMISFLALIAALISGGDVAAALPEPPEDLRPCVIPPSATPVSTVAQLQSALAGKTARDIEVKAGDYKPALVLTPAAPHRLWGSHADNVTIRAGFQFTGAGAPGFSVRCITLNVSQNNRSDQRSGTSIINTIRGWTNVTIADSRLLGNMTIGRAVLAQVPQGLTVERTEIRDFHTDGIRVKPGAGPVNLRDLSITNIFLPGPAHRSGTAEFGIMVDTPATIERVRVRNAYWAGVSTYGPDITISDLDSDGSIAGVYVEHYTHRLVLENFRLGPLNQRGVNFEWDDPTRYSGAPTSVDVLIQDGLIEAYKVGAAVMDGQRNPTIRRVTFVGQCGAAIIGGRNRSTGEVYVENDYSGIDPGAFEITSKHHNGMKCS